MTVYQVKFNFYSHCSICRLESSYSPSTKEPERKRKELFSVNLDQPNHEKELNKVWGKMGFILPGWSEVLEHKMGGGTFLLIPFFFLLYFPLRQQATRLLIPTFFCMMLQKTQTLSPHCATGKLWHWAPWQVAYCRKCESPDSGLQPSSRYISSGKLLGQVAHF